MTALRMLWGPTAIGQVTAQSAALLGAALNDADNAVGWTFNIPKDGTITDVGFLITAVNGTPPSYNVGLTTQDSSARPTTSAYGSSAITGYTPTSTGWKWITLGTAASTAAAGDYAAVHIYPTGTAPTGVNNISVCRGPVAEFGGATVFFTTAWAVTGGGFAAPFAIKYNDGSIHGFALSSATAHAQIRQNTTPDEIGCKFTLPTAATAYGARLTVSAWGTAATADVILYDASSGVLASTNISDKDFPEDASNVDVFFDSVSLAANTTYRLVVRPNVGANGDITVTKWTFESTAAKAFVPHGAYWQYTFRTDAGSWDDTETTAMAPMGLWVNDVTFISGTGTTGAEWGFVG